MASIVASVINIFDACALRVERAARYTEHSHFGLVSTQKSVVYVRPRGADGCTITVEVTPGAKFTEIAGVDKWRAALQVRIAAEPRQGQANAELIRFLSHVLEAPKSSISIVKGEKTSLKVIAVPLSAEKVRTVLGGEHADS